MDMHSLYLSRQEVVKTFHFLTERLSTILLALVYLEEQPRPQSGEAKEALEEIRSETQRAIDELTKIRDAII
jgi:hypothetical protein